MKMKIVWFCLAGVMGMSSGGLGAADNDEALAIVAEAERAFQSGDHEKALVLATDAIDKSPNNPQVTGFRGRLYSALRNHASAVKDFTRALELNPDEDLLAEVYQERGASHFKLAAIEASIADFDSYLKLRPKQDPYHWQRGISYYYAGQFVKGQKQFERHQEVNSHDVENAVWHFLCKLRATDFKAAQKALIPIKGDGRVPMMEVHAIFSGKSTPEKVMAKAKAGKADKARRNRQVFYANLYLGLWFEANGDAKEAAKYIAQAAMVGDEQGYMGDVARVHAQLREIKVPKKPKQP